MTGPPRTVSPAPGRPASSRGVVGECPHAVLDRIRNDQFLLNQATQHHKGGGGLAEHLDRLPAPVRSGVERADPAEARRQRPGAAPQDLVGDGHAVVAGPAAVVAATVGPDQALQVPSTRLPFHALVAVGARRWVCLGGTDALQPHPTWQPRRRRIMDCTCRSRPSQSRPRRPTTVGLASPPATSCSVRSVRDLVPALTPTRRIQGLGLGVRRPPLRFALWTRQRGHGRTGDGSPHPARPSGCMPCALSAATTLDTTSRPWPDGYQGLRPRVGCLLHRLTHPDSLARDLSDPLPLLG